MGIFRGTGGTGDATTNVTINEVTQQATNAAQSASDAASSASTATNKANEASASATTATNKANEASTSAQSAATSYDNFDDRYLGDKASDPSVDNDGDALLTGALYFNTTNNTLRVYNGSSWQESLSDIVTDTTPQLGGDLDLNSSDITGTGDIDITGSVTSDSVTLEPTADHSILSLQNTSTNTFGNSKSYHEIRWDAKDLGGADVTYGEIEGRTVATGSKGKLNFNVKGSSLESYVVLDGDSENIQALKDFDVTGDITVSGTVDGRDLSTDGTKLDTIETNADVTDSVNVTAAGALMDSEVTNLQQVKDFDSSDYATAAQGTTADSALQNVSEDTTPQLGGNLDLNSNDITGTGDIDVTGTVTSQGVTVEPTSAHSIVSLQNTATNTFGNSLSYHEIQWDAKDLGGADVTYAELKGQTVATGSRGKLNLNVKGASGLATYITLDGDDQNIKAFKDFDVTGNIDVSGNAIIDGDLTVSGTTTTVNTETINLADNLITLNSNEDGTPTQNAGIEIERGTSTNKVFQWNETSDYWETDDDLNVAGNITLTGTVDGRDLVNDGTKLDGIEELADVTDSINVQAAGALMDSEVTNLQQVKDFDSSDYATAAQGTTADSALQDGDTVSSLTITSADINSGNIDNTVIGDSTAVAGTFTSLTGDDLIVEPTSDHAIVSLRNTATNTFGNSKSYHEIRWEAKDLGGSDVIYGEIEGRTVATGSRGKLNFNVKGASFESYLTLDGDDQNIKALKDLDVTGTVTADENITIDTSSSGNGLTIQSSGNTYNRLTLDANRSASGNLLGEVLGQWDGTQVASVRLHAGSDTTNKDDGEIAFLTSSAGSLAEAMRIDSSGNVGIGVTPSTSANLTNIEMPNGVQIGARNLSTVPQMYLSSNVSGDAYAPTYKVNGYATQYRIESSGGQHEWYIAPSGTAGNAISFTQAMTLDSSGNLGIGRTPVSTLHVEDAVSTVYSSSAVPDSGNCILAIGNKQTTESTNDHATLQFNVNGGTHNRVGAISFVAENSANRKGAMTFGVDNGTTREEAARIDSSGNLLVGKTTTALGTDGARLGAAGEATSFVRNNDTPLFLNRKTSDGDIVSFRKDGSSVGSIYTNAADGGSASELCIASGNTGLKFDDVNNYIRPTNSAGAVRDNTVDLGSSTSRFKDLRLSNNVYASGKVYAGGTSATSAGQLAVINSSNPYLSFHEGSNRRAYIQYLTTDHELYLKNEESTVVSLASNGNTLLELKKGSNKFAQFGFFDGTNDDVFLRHGNDDWIIYGRKDANTWLYYNNDWKIRTESDGVNVRNALRSHDGDLNLNRAGSTTARLRITSSSTISDQDLTVNSDERIKDNIEVIDSALDKVQGIRGVHYNRTDTDDPEKEHTGVIAQDVEKVLPQVVHEDDKGIKSVAYGNMVGLLIEAIKEQQTQIDDLKAEVTRLKGFE